MSFQFYSHIFHSKAIEGRRVYRIILPEQRSANKLPLLILLHGVHGTETDWTEQGHLLAQVNELFHSGQIGPMAILMPSDGLTGIGTGYLNWAEGSSHLYEDYLLKELIPEVERRFEVGGKRSMRSISGLSMGGFAAIRFALAYPDHFTMASSLSGFFDVRELGNLVGPETYYQIFRGSTNSMDKVSPQIMEIRQSERLPELYLDCGTDDKYLSMNRQFHERLLSSNIPHNYEEHPGGHTWEYWGTHIKKHLLRHHHCFIR